MHRCWPVAAPLAVRLLLLLLFLVKIPASAATDDGTAGEDEDAGAGWFSLLGALVRATASRLSGMLTGSSAVYFLQDEDGAEAPRRVRYHGYQLLRVRVRNQEEGGQLRQLVEQEEGAQLWQHALRNHTADVLLPPAAVAEVKDSLEYWGLDYTVISADVQKMIAYHNPPKQTVQRRTHMLRSRGHQFTWKRYHRYEDILKYMQYLAAAYPKRAQLITLGSTSEGLPLVALKAFTREDVRSDRDRPQPRTNTTSSRRRPRAKAKRTRKDKPAVWIDAEISFLIARAHSGAHGREWIDAGAHGREWIGPAVALYLCMQLVERQRHHRSLVAAADWYILPVLNPDGYEYSHSVDRLWRKTRSSHEAATATARVSARRFFHGRPCMGVDLNRNWDFHWGDHGASDDPCSDLYAGPRPFSEPEARATANFISARKHRVQLYVTLHSYSQLWLLPWAHTKKHSTDYQDLYNKAQVAVNALRRVRGTSYQIGTAADLLYSLSGNSDSWAKGAAGIRYSYAVELPDRGLFGFLLPASSIIPTSRETFAGLKALAKSIVCK